MRPSTQAFRGMSRLQIRAIAVHTFVVVFSWEKCWFIFFLIIWILTWQFWRKQTAEVLFLSFFIDTFYIPWFRCTVKPPIPPLSGLAKKRQHWKNGGKGSYILPTYQEKTYLGLENWPRYWGEAVNGGAVLEGSTVIPFLSFLCMVDLTRNNSIQTLIDLLTIIYIRKPTLHIIMIYYYII